MQINIFFNFIINIALYNYTHIKIPRKICDFQTMTVNSTVTFHKLISQ